MHAHTYTHAYTHTHTLSPPHTGLLKRPESRVQFMEKTAGFDRLCGLVDLTSAGGGVRADLLSAQEQYQLLTCIWFLSYTTQYVPRLMSDALLKYMRHVLSNT